MRILKFITSIRMGNYYYTYYDDQNNFQEKVYLAVQPSVLAKYYQLICPIVSNVLFGLIIIMGMLIGLCHILSPVEIETDHNSVLIMYYFLFIAVVCLQITKLMELYWLHTVTLFGEYHVQIQRYGWFTRTVSYEEIAKELTRRKVKKGFGLQNLILMI